MSRAKLTFHSSDHETFEWNYGRGSETSISVNCQYMKFDMLVCVFVFSGGRLSLVSKR